MKTLSQTCWSIAWRAALLSSWITGAPLSKASDPAVEVGIAVRDITPELPIWLAGYAARNRPADRADTRLVAQALAFRNPGGECWVVVALDNCEVNHDWNEPLLKDLESQFGLKRGRVMIVSSHTHAAPVLEYALEDMYAMPDTDRARVREYGQALRAKLLEVVGAALADFRPASLEHGLGRATFAMNRRVYRDDQIAFGENPDGPTDWEVPVLAIKGATNVLRAVVFGYACHGTSIHGEDFYTVSGDYMGYARQHLEAVYPGVTALYLTGMGADSNPAPRGHLLDAKRHGLELAGAVAGVLTHPMRPVRGPLKAAYEEIDLPLEPAPSQAQLEQDAQSQDRHIQHRAKGYLRRLREGKPLPAVRLPVAVMSFGRDLTFIAVGGEVVVDYALRFKRLFASDHPWVIGYAYEVPCYIPSVRILKEGGYEAQSSLIYYGIYGPFRPTLEGLLVKHVSTLLDRVRQE